MNGCGLVSVWLFFAIGCGARSSVTHGPPVTEPVFASVVAYYESGDLVGAITELRRLSRRYPEEPQIYFMLGNALYRYGNLRDASFEYERALQLRPHDLEAYVSRGFALYELGDCEQSRAEWASAVTVNPREPLARAALAVGFHCSGQLDAAVSEYAKAIALDHRYETPRNLQIDIRWKARAVAALEQLQHLITTVPEQTFSVDPGGMR
jgi:tetratricopeptide (TPR) repeat protein